MILDKKAILQAQDIKKELLYIPEWGGDVYIRGMSGVQRDKFEALILQAKEKDGAENFRAKFASMTICDEDGNLLFGEEDIIELSKKSASALQRVFIAAQKLSRIGQNEINEMSRELQDNPFVDSASALP